MKFIKEVNEFLSENFSEFKVEGGVNLTSIYVINVYGLNKGHSFSIKLSTFPEDEVSLFGYNYEEMLDMNYENLASLFELALKMKKFGIRIVFNVNGDRTHAIKFVDTEPLTPERAIQIYKEHKISCGEEVLPCILECSNFDGSINFSVQVY